MSQIAVTSLKPSGRRSGLGYLFVLATAILLFLACFGISKAADESEPMNLLWQKGVGGCKGDECAYKVNGTDVGTGIPRGIAADPVSGHVYVADQSNFRIIEFTTWGTFVKAWGWGVRDGSPELQTCGPGSSPPSADCEPGLKGSGPGQFSSVRGVSLDSSGNLYVEDGANHRVQKFGPDGSFLLMFGGGVNQGPGHPGDICTATHAAEGDICGAGSPGNGNSQFSIEWQYRTHIAIGPGDQVYVGDKNRIQRFDSGGNYVSQVPLPEPGEVGSLAVDPVSGDLYFAYLAFSGSYGQFPPNVFRLNSETGEVLDTLEVEVPSALATDSAGNVYVYNQRVFGDIFQPGNHVSRIMRFNAKGEETANFAENGLEPDDNLTSAGGLAANTISAAGGVDVYVSRADNGLSFVNAYGQPPAELEPPPPVAPSIGESFAASVDSESAMLHAKINPHFWDNATYYVQYGAGDCAANPCTEFPTAPGAQLTSRVLDSAVTSNGVFLTDLQPDTTYHYRFVSLSGGGGPVFGPDRTFTTFPSPAPPATNCPNQALRSGASAFLPDCRAYELVSPLEKSNSDVLSRLNVTGYPTALSRATRDGAKLTYTSYRAFGDTAAAPYASQYIAARGAGGWESEPIVAPLGTADEKLDTEFKAFSEDLCSAWIQHRVEPTLDPAAPLGFPDLYRRKNCDGAGGYQALNTTIPPGVPADQFKLELQGLSADGSHAVFTANDRLTPDASSIAGFQVYESFGGQLRLVSVLPNGKASSQYSSVGVSNDIGDVTGHVQRVENAVSEDGSRIYWTAAAGTIGQGAGKIYVRLNGAVTLRVSDTASTAAASYWTASADGAKALFTIGEDLYEYDLGAEDSTLLAPKVKGVVGASKDLSHIYFVSNEVLAEGANAGEPNLYLRRDGATRLVATLSDSDIGGSEAYPTPIARIPLKHAARVTPDGEGLAFISNASLTGYDNTDLDSGVPDSEIYAYDAAGVGELSCVSCLATGARPRGRQLRSGTFEFWAAATITPWNTQLYADRALSDDGQRLFFTSFDALVSRDTNGKADVYQWEASGKGECSPSAPAYSPANGGCVALISSGESPADSEFLEASPAGDDVYFATGSSLVAQDPGLVDIYDARVNGGFPAPPAAPAACEGEACQAPPAPPNDPTPSSSSFQGAGNVVTKPARKKHRHKKSKQQRHKKRSEKSQNRRGGSK